MACRVVAISCERIVINFVAKYFALARKFFFFFVSDAAQEVTKL